MLTIVTGFGVPLLEENSVIWCPNDKYLYILQGLANRRVDQEGQSTAVLRHTILEIKALELTGFYSVVGKPNWWISSWEFSNLAV